MSRLAAVIVGFAIGCGGGSSPGAPDASTDAAPVPDSIDEFLAGVSDLECSEQVTEYPGYRLFLCSYPQPLDHADPDSVRFRQQFTLHHLDRSAPMVLYTSGYYLFRHDYVSELGVALPANQISTEQRFFGSSRPDDVATADWQHMTIEQAAGDHHRLVQLLAPYYAAPWVSTGHSKGGMTSVYHRRFYPDDVAATVAYVAPISFGAPDARYEAFFSQVADAGCRQALEAFQVEALTRFDLLLPTAQRYAQEMGLTYTRAGGHAAAFESELAGLHWSFWQYAGADACAEIPAADASDDDLFYFAVNVGGLGADDDAIGALETYYFQAERELGYPSVPIAHVESLLQHAEVPGDYLPTGTAPVYQPAAMTDIDDWVQAEGSQLLFIYGEYDPWVSGAFELGSATDSARYVAAGRNHGALIRHLDSSEQDAIAADLERWLGAAPTFNRRARTWAPPLIRVPPRLR